MRALRLLRSFLVAATPVLWLLAGATPRVHAQEEPAAPVERESAGGARLPAECRVVKGPIEIDGKLDESEWGPAERITIADEATQFVRRDPEYAGPSDLSGWVKCLRSATTLYIAGEVADDTLFWNPQISWMGDGVELFFDFHPRRNERDAEAGYDEYAHQLLLHPLASDVRWRFARFRGEDVGTRTDVPVDGVELAGLPRRDDKLATVGYTFELALPLANFPAFAEFEPGDTFGFDVALSDSDGLPRQKNYATWGGHERLADFPSRFGLLRLVDAPPPPPPPERRRLSPLLPLALLVSALGALLFVWLARIPTLSERHRLWRVFRSIAGWSMAVKLALSATLVVGILGAGWVSDIAGAGFLQRDVAGKRELLATIADIAEEARSLNLLTPQPPEHPAPLLSLLAGKSIEPLAEFDYSLVPLEREDLGRTLSGVDFLRRDIPVHAPWSSEFLVHPPQAAHGATVIHSFEPAEGVAPPALDQRVASIRFLHRDGSTSAPLELVWGRNAAASTEPIAAGATQTSAAPEARVAFVEGQGQDSSRVAFEASVEFPPEAGPVVGIEIERGDPTGTLRLHGVTLHPRSGTDAVPLPLGRRTVRGVPTDAHPFPTESSGITLSKDHPRVVVRSDVAADRAWLVASLVGPYPAHRFRVPVLRVELVFDDGSVEGPFRLENGVTVETESQLARQRGEDFRSELAFEWAEPGQTRRHYDIFEMELARRGRRLVEAQFEFLGDDEQVRLSSLVCGEELPPVVGDGLRLLGQEDGGYRIWTPELESLDGLDFTAFRDGRAVATTLTGQARDRGLARSLTEERGSQIEAAADGLHHVEIVAGERLHTLAMSFPGAGAQVLEMTWTTRPDQEFGLDVGLLRVALATLLVPLLVVIAASLLLRIPSVHARLAAAFAAAAAVPVVLGFFVVPELLGGKIEQDEGEAVARKAAIVKERLSALRSVARQAAEAALRDEALQEALRRRGAPEFRPAIAAALRDIQQNLTGVHAGGARVALQIAPLSSGGADTIVFPEEVRHTLFADPSVRLTDQLEYRASRLTARGVARDDAGGDWRTDLLVELPLDGSALLDAAGAAGGGTEVLLYSPRGYPVVGTVQVDGEDSPDELSRKKDLLETVLESPRPVVEARVLGGSLYTVSYDVLRGQGGVVSLVATALPRNTTEALQNRVGAVALLVFGAGVLMQFLLAGVVVHGTTQPLARILERARLTSRPSTDGSDELTHLGGSMGKLEADREQFRAELAHLYEAVGELAHQYDPDEVLTRALQILDRTVEPWGVLILARDRSERVRVLLGRKGDERIRDRGVEIASNSPLAPAIAGAAEAHVPDLSLESDPLSAGERQLLSDVRSLTAYPLGTGSAASGALVLLENEVDAVRTEQFHPEFLATFARQLGMALESARYVRLAVRDPGTRAYVTSYFEQRLDGEIDRALAGKSSIALLLVRADELPDEPGAADAVLARLADTLRAVAPSRAFLGRTDDDQLALAVPEADRAAADALVLSLRRTLAERGLARHRIKTGVAACPEDAGSSEFLRAEARDALEGEGSSRRRDATTVTTDQQTRLQLEARRHGVVLASPDGLRILETIDRIAGSDLTILIQGETGVGKEVVADLIHRKSSRSAERLVRVNCAALPDALLESELFGYERGAFTGATQTKPGRFELADRGTLFLDEIGDMPLETQVKLLRVLEDRAVEHLGGTGPIPVDVRVIAATHRDLHTAIDRGRFREDLYYRLNGVTVAVPPLRARREDIPVLARAFVESAAEKHGRGTPTLGADAIDALLRHDWPGNARELKNVLEQAVVLTAGDELRAADVAPAIEASARRGSLKSTRKPTTAPPATPAGLRLPSDLSDRQRRLLVLLSEREWVTNSDYCEQVSISTRTGLRDLKELLARDLIVMEGKRRGAKYRLKR